MGIFWSSTSASEPSREPPNLPHLEDHPLSWKQHPEYVKPVERLKLQSPAIAKLNDEQIGNAFLIMQASKDKGRDARKLSEVLLTIAQAESSLRKISTEHARSSEIGIFQQNEQFAQRDSKGFWTKKLSKETRLDTNDSVNRNYRILDKEQYGENDWRDAKVEYASYKLQRCEPKHKDIYADPERQEVASVLSKFYFPNHESMIHKSSAGYSQTTSTIPNSSPVVSRGTSAIPNSPPVLFQGTGDRQTSMAFDGGPRQQPYTGPRDPHSVVDLFKSKGMDSSLANRARVAEHLNIPGVAGTAEHNTSLLRALR